MGEEIEADDDVPEATDWIAILTASDESEPWIELTPERVSILSLEDCDYQLARSESDVDRLALAAKAAHHALQAALTAALAGSANIGAHPARLRVAYLQYLEDSRTRSVEAPVSDRVMFFDELLDAAINEPLPWTQVPLEVTDDERELLNRLTAIRHAVEHPKQSFHFIEPAYVAQALPIAARLTVVLLQSVAHHLEEGCLASIEILRARISEVSLKRS